MVITLKKEKLTIDQLKSGKINENIFSESEIQVLNIIRNWFSGDKSFRLTTSGSTGKPKEIELSGDVLKYSAKLSLDRLDPEARFKNTLLCINPSYVGGLMVVIRALVREMDLIILNPATDPTEVYNEKIDLVSMVPLQVQQILESHPKRLLNYNTILIGGAPMSESHTRLLRDLPTVHCYHTYGMTETASHIALRNLSLGEQFFKTLGDIQLDQDERECLRVKGTVTGHKWLQTNDVVQILDCDHFVIQGRMDNVINSGGLKIHPEKIEDKLIRHIGSPFFIIGMPDQKFGERVTLVIEGEKNKETLDFSCLSPYEKPREIIYLSQFTYTRTGKINRSETLKTIQ